ncbi:MAG: DinB family protein [Chloroflexi bacterium]|nr:DinB family protein [Chloroflexota bacterium]
MSSDRYAQLIRYVRLARGLEAEGFYGVAKLLWGLAFADEIRASSAEPLPRPHTTLDSELSALIDSLRASQKPEIIAALERGQQAARENHPVTYEDVPEVAVCRYCGQLFLGHTPEQCPACGAAHLTFRQFRPVYYFDPLTPPQALAALENGPQHIQRALDGFSAQQMTQPPAPNEWSARDLLWHLLIAQELLRVRAEKILDEHNPLLEGVAAWDMTSQQALPAGEIWERYRESRQATLERLRAAGDAWWRTGWHSEFGSVTLLDQATYFARHEHMHLGQFAQIRHAVLKR